MKTLVWMFVVVVVLPLGGSSWIIVSPSPLVRHPPTKKIVVSASYYDRTQKQVEPVRFHNNNQSRLSSRTRKDDEKSAKETNRKNTLYLGSLFTVWYILSVAYNIYTKRALNIISTTASIPSLSWITAALQMPVGLGLVALPLWICKFREPPQNMKFPKDTIPILPLALLHALVHIGGVVSMGAGAVSFTYIVKASEPASTAFLAALTGSVLPFTVYLTILPVMVGVAIASVSELTFTWKSFNYAMISNLASSARGVVGKKSMEGIHKLSAPNLMAVLTFLASLFLIPTAILMDGGPRVIQNAFQTLHANQTLLPYFLNTFLGGMCYYLYNEFAFLCLDNTSSVTYALGNTLKRIFIILSSMIVFGNRMTLRGAIGSFLAIGGVYLYSIEKTRTAKKVIQTLTKRDSP